MVALVREAQLEEVTRATALECLNQWRTNSPLDGIGRIGRFVRRHLHLINEPVETLHAPAWLLSEIRAGRPVWGDCDDAAMLVATLGTAMGLQARFVAVRPPAADEYVHVFAEFQMDPETWVYVDPTSRRRPPDNWERLTLEV